ncbi:MAG: type IVB secretion system coupling complex protein DotM/IcmP [Gammaproteobacteria bacterium]|nr:type IVB secretion system coupling complex protein DotM/IcmP [Gammaproteobacteria bacterium]
MPAAQPGQQREEGSLDFVWMIVLVIVLVLAIWYFGGSYITEAVFYMKLYEIAMIKFVARIFNGFAYHLHIPTIDLSNLIAVEQFIHTHTGSIQFKMLLKVDAIVGRFMRYPIILLLLLMAAVLYFRGIILRYSSTYSMQSLRDEEQVNWPRIMPIVHLDLVNEDLDKAPWSMALSPMSFCKKFNLLKEHREYGKTTVTVLRDRAYTKFALQLGPAWKGPQNLPDYMIALLAIFAARANGEIEAVDKLIDQISLSAANGAKPDYGDSKRLLAKNMNSKLVTKIMQSHSYIFTIMASMLELARTSGVLASADFIWLKPIDRSLWYVLNSVGRPTAFVEVAGVFSHWMAEKKLGWPIRTPMVDEAVKGLEEAVAEVLYEPDEA